MTGPVGGAGELTAHEVCRLLEECSTSSSQPYDGTQTFNHLDFNALTRLLNTKLAAKAPQGVPPVEAEAVNSTNGNMVGFNVKIFGVDFGFHGSETPLGRALAAPRLPGPVSDDTIHHGMVPPAEIEAIDDREKTKRALDALDRLCDMWAEEVDLERIVKVISGQPDKVRAMLRQSWIEGAYRGRMSAIDYPPREAAAPKPAPEQATAGSTLGGNIGEMLTTVSSGMAQALAWRPTPAPGAERLREALERCLIFMESIKLVDAKEFDAHGLKWAASRWRFDVKERGDAIKAVREALAAAPPAPEQSIRDFIAQEIKIAIGDRHASAERVRKLIAKWRKDAAGYRNEAKSAQAVDSHNNAKMGLALAELWEQCANELEQSVWP